MCEVPDWGLASWSWFGYGPWSLIHPWSKLWLCILILKVQRKSMCYKSSFGALDMVTGLWYTNDPNLSYLSWFWRCKEHPCPLSHHLGLWRMLDVPDWGLVPISLFWNTQWSLMHPWSGFGSISLFLRCKEHLCPLSPDLGFWEC